MTQEMTQVRDWAERVLRCIEGVIFGKSATIEKLLVSLLCRGHALLEDVPGVGKTILARALAQAIGGEFKRVQCTPDLLPADVLGVSVYNPKTGEFNYREGPIVTNVLLVDEINRATPRTQSALLEAMAENQINVDGTNLALPDPFFLIATENPVEFEGTFPLPEAQKDRFFMVVDIGYPSREAEEEILESQRRITHPVTDIEAVADMGSLLEMQRLLLEVHVSEEIRTYILNITGETRKDPRIQLGVSPRGSLALFRGAQALAALRGRDYVVPEDVKELVLPVLSKRIIVKSEHSIRGLTERRAIGDIVERVEVPVFKAER
jgi:MoxR-like ATPase